MSMSAPESLQRQLLAEALQLSRQVETGLAELARQERLRDIGQKLQGFAHPLQRDRLDLTAIPLPVRQTFVKAALLLSRYPQVGGLNWQGSLRSPTLSQYQPDRIPPTLLAEESLAQLGQLFDLPDSYLDELTEVLAKVDRRIERRRRVIQAVLEEMKVPGQTAIVFQHLFGAVPMPAQALNWVATEMQIFFCIHYAQGCLYSDDEQGKSCFELWNRLSPEDRDQLQQFLTELERFSYGKFDRFPVFGPCDPSRIDYAWCDRIAQKTGSSWAEVIQVLSQSVSIIPSQKAEAFLVHDIWGHHWQLLLTEFAADYNLLATCGEALRAGETAYTSEGPLSCRNLFSVVGDRVYLDQERSRLFFQGEVQQRLGLLFTHLIGEMLADAAEFKFAWDYPQQIAQLQSSSVFAHTPTKLDLSLTDIDFLFLEVLRPLLEMSLSALTETPLEADLLADWAAAGGPSLELRTSLKQALAEMYQVFLAEYNATYLPTLTGDVGLFTKLVSNLLYLQNAINQLYTDAEAAAELPFQDLLLLFVGCYCSSDSYAEFWAIDDVLAAYFLPCWQRLFDWHRAQTS
ncbi:MAG: hypothetical protein KME35_12005 [Aphanocapsa sp. GSE-SYN-MK-11-07L]|nr:hypothetical protein [Aphanocapsa sp. GSE-SYN-MK-11-07L]